MALDESLVFHIIKWFILNLKCKCFKNWLNNNLSIKNIYVKLIIKIIEKLIKM